jgi:hypothetical protein
MELSYANGGTIIDLSKKLLAAKTLTIHLDASNTKVFHDTLLSSKSFFPLTFNKYSALSCKNLDQLKPKQKNELKDLLASEIKPIAEEANLKAQQSKTIHGEVLPADLGACLHSLADMRDEKILKIRKLEKEIEEVIFGRTLVELMQENNDIIECLQPAKKQKI